MKRSVIFLLTAALLVGCTGQSPSSSPAANPPGKGRDTGVALHDNAPDLNRVSAEEFIDYFRNDPDFAELPDYQDPRDPYTDRNAAQKASAGKGVKEFYDQQTVLTGKVSSHVEKLVNIHNDTAGLDTMILMFFLPLNSMDVALGATFTEQQDWGSVSSGVQMAYSYMNGVSAAVTRNAAHDYTVSYEKESIATEDAFRANPNLGFQMVRRQKGEVKTLFEYLNPQEGLHVWQSSKERLVVEFQGETLVRYAYTSLLDAKAPHGEADLLLDAAPERDTQAWLDWALCGTTHRRENNKNFSIWLHFDGEALYLTNSSGFFGDPPHVAIPAA